MPGGKNIQSQSHKSFSNFMDTRTIPLWCINQGQSVFLVAWPSVNEPDDFAVFSGCSQSCRLADMELMSCSDSRKGWVQIGSGKEC